MNQTKTTQTESIQNGVSGATLLSLSPFYVRMKFRHSVTRKRLLPMLMAATGIAAGLGSVAQSATVVINPNQDNSIYSESDNSNALGGLFAGETVGGNLRRALLEFDIAGSGIPAGSIINSVTLSLAQTKIGPAGTATFELHPLLAAWGEGTSAGTGTGGAPTAGDATWNFKLFNTSSWVTPGGDFGPTSGTASFGTTNTIYTFVSQAGLVADVQGWLNTPSSNFGWILRAAVESPGVTTAREFGSRESSPAQRPALTVNFTTVPEPTSVAMLVMGCGALAVARRCGIF